MPVKKYSISFLVLIAALTAVSSARADFFVVSSNSKNFHVGDEIREAASIDLADQELLRVLDKATGETRIIVGPYKGPLNEYKAPCTSQAKFSPDCNPIKRSKPAGASRGLQKRAPSDDEP